MRVMVLYLRVPNRPQKAVYSVWRLEKIPGDLSPFSKEGNGFIPAKGKEHLIRPYIRSEKQKTGPDPADLSSFLIVLLFS